MQSEEDPPADLLSRHVGASPVEQALRGFQVDDPAGRIQPVQKVGGRLAQATADLKYLGARLEGHAVDQALDQSSADKRKDLLLVKPAALFLVGHLARGRCLRRVRRLRHSDVDSSRNDARALAWQQMKPRLPSAIYAIGATSSPGRPACLIV